LAEVAGGLVEGLLEGLLEQVLSKTMLSELVRSEQGMADVLDGKATAVGSGRGCR